MEPLGIDPGIVAVLCIVAVGIILTILAIITCAVCNICCRSGKSRCSIYHEERHQDRRQTSRSNEEATTATVRTTHDVECGEPKNSTLVKEAPPTYNMATEYPVVYAGQYCIGMNGDSRLMPSNDTQPPDYNSVATSSHYSSTV